MLIKEVPRTFQRAETEFGYPTTRWVPGWTRAEGVNPLQPAGRAQNWACEHQKAESVEERLDQAIEQLGAGSLLEARELGTARKRELAVKLRSGYPVSLLCRLLDLPRSSYYYRPGTTRDSPLSDAVQRVLQDHSGYGYRRIAVQLQQEGWDVSPKRVYLLLRRLRNLEE